MWKKVFFILITFVLCSACEDSDEVLIDRLEGEWVVDYFVTEGYDTSTGELVSRRVRGGSAHNTCFNFIDDKHCHILWGGHNHGTLGYFISDGWLVLPEFLGRYKVRVNGNQMLMEGEKEERGDWFMYYKMHLLRVGTKVPRSQPTFRSDKQLLNMLQGTWCRIFELDWRSDIPTGEFLSSYNMYYELGQTLEFRNDGICRIVDVNSFEQVTEQNYSVMNGLLEIGKNRPFHYSLCFINNELRLFYDYESFAEFEPGKKYTNYHEERLVRVK